jgi:hypothetical protein
MVTGTTRRAGQASIIATSVPPPARPGTRYGRDAEAAVLQRLLLDRIGGEAGDRAGLCQLHGAFDGGQRRRRVGGIGWPAGPAPRAARQHRQRRRERLRRLGRLRSPARARRGRACGERREPGGSSIAKNGRVASRASQALRLSSPPTPAGSPIVTASGSGGHGCLMSMVATRRISRM